MFYCYVLYYYRLVLRCDCFEDFAKIFAIYILRGMGVFEFEVLMFYMFSLCALVSVALYCS